MSDFWIKDGETLLLIGDSITDRGRRGDSPPLGSGYVRMFADLVTARYPERQITYINRGISGNRISDLKDRWRDDVLYQKPDRLTIKIGINDLHSYLRDPNEGLGPDLYAEIFAELMETTKRELDIPVALLTPFYISTDRSGTTLRSEVLDLIPRYIETVERMSQEYDTPIVRLHDIFQEHLKYRDADTFCPEPVHPYNSGHLIIANALFEVLSKAG